MPEEEQVPPELPKRTPNANLPAEENESTAGEANAHPANPLTIRKIADFLKNGRRNPADPSYNPN